MALTPLPAALVMPKEKDGNIIRPEGQGRQRHQAIVVGRGKETGSLRGHVVFRLARSGKIVGNSGCRINLVRIRRFSDPVAGSCYSALARANKSWSRYRRPKIERSCTEAYPERDARTRQTKFLIPIRRTPIKLGSRLPTPTRYFLDPPY